MTSLVGDTRSRGTSLRIPWKEIQTEWRTREYSTARREVSKLDGLVVDEIDELLFAANTLDETHARNTLGRAFAAAASSPDGELLLALYLYGRCLEKWEKSEDYTRIVTVLDALRDVFTTRTDEASPSDGRAQLLSIIVRQAQLLETAMDVEDALGCSCPVATGERARRVVAGLDELLAEKAALEGAALDDGIADLRTVVRSDAETSRLYFKTIAKVADTVLAFVDPEAPIPPNFDKALQALILADDDAALADDVYRSELRAHRASLEGLRDSAGEPSLQVEAAELVYVYPFALKGGGGKELRAAEIVARALDGTIVEKLHEKGFRSAKARELELNDLWESPDARAVGYSGASIELAPIAVTPTGDENEQLDFDAEVRLSRLGNHHVRVSSRLGRAGLHELNQALRRGSLGMGDETFETEGPPDHNWTKFPHYVDAVIKAIETALGAERVLNLSATFHVVLAARSISLRSPDGSTDPVTDGARLEHELGASLLFHPVRHLATALEEWVRYPSPSVTNLLGEQGFVGDLVVRTDNTTVSFMPASAEWLVDEYEEMVEFVASIPPLLTLWENRARALTGRVDGALPELERQLLYLAPNKDRAGDSDHARKRAKGPDPVHTLYEQEMEIRRLESDIRGRLAFLHSPELCRTRGQREFLDALWRAAGLRRQERELERRLQVLAERQERIATMVSSFDALVRRKQRERAEQLERPVTVLLAVLGVASLAGVLDWTNGAFDVAGRTWAWGEASILIVTTLLVAALYLKHYWSTRKTE